MGCSRRCTQRSIKTQAVPAKLTQTQQQTNQEEGGEEPQTTSLTLTRHEESRDVSQAPYVQFHTASFHTTPYTDRMDTHSESRTDIIILAEGSFTVDGYLQLHVAATYWLEVLERVQLLLTFHPTTFEVDEAVEKLLEVNEVVLGLQNTVIRYWRAADGGEYLAKLGGWETADGKWTGSVMMAVDGRIPVPDAPICALATDQRLYHLFYDEGNANMATLWGQGMALEADLDVCAVPGWNASMAMERVVYIISTIKHTVYEHS